MKRRALCLIAAAVLALAAGIVLAVMLLPYLISASSETMLKARTRCLPSAMALGISKWDAAAGIVLPASARNILMWFIPYLPKPVCCR